MHASHHALTDASRQSLLRCDIDLNAAGKANGFVRLPHSVHRSAYGWVPIPVTRIRNGEGPRILMVAGNHGDEWEGQIGLGRLIRDLQPEQLSGTLVILPSLNFPAAMAGQRTSPVDEGNLNRAFPGDSHGGMTAQIAWWIEHALLPGFDVAFDLHSGGSSLSYLPSTLAYRQPTPAMQQRVEELMAAFGAPVAFFSDAPGSGGRSFSAAALRQGVLCMATEVGGGGLVTPASMASMHQGLQRVLQHLGLIEADELPPPAPTRRMRVGGDDHHVFAMEAGLFEPLVEVGDLVCAGQPAARIHFHDTPWREPMLLRFEIDGLLLCKRVPALCQRGDCLFQLGSDDAATWA